MENKRIDIVKSEALTNTAWALLFWEEEGLLASKPLSTARVTFSVSSCADIFDFNDSLRLYLVESSVSSWIAGSYHVSPHQAMSAVMLCRSSCPCPPRPERRPNAEWSCFCQKIMALCLLFMDFFSHNWNFRHQPPTPSNQQHQTFWLSPSLAKACLRSSNVSREERCSYCEGKYQFEICSSLLFYCYDGRR